MSHRRLVVAFVSAFCVASVGLVTSTGVGDGAADEKPTATRDRRHADRDPHRGDRRRGHPARAGRVRRRPRRGAGVREVHQRAGRPRGPQGRRRLLDSKLNGDETRNAIIKACQNDFAVVGTGALFMNNVDDLVACPDKAGAKTGLPDVPVVTLWEVQQNSPVSFPITAPSKVFSDPTRRHLPGARRSLPLVPAARVEGSARRVPRGRRPRGAEDRFDADLARRAEGRRSRATACTTIHGADGQDKYLPIATAIQSDGSTIVSSAVNDTSQAYMLKEAAVQGVNTVKVWDCTSACYSKRFLETAGAKADGQYVDMPFVPVEEAKYSPAVKAYVKAVGDGVIDGNGEQAWAAALFFRDAVNAVGEERRGQRADPGQLAHRPRRTSTRSTPTGCWPRATSRPRRPRRAPRCSR